MVVITGLGCFQIWGLYAILAAIFIFIAWTVIDNRKEGQKQ